MRLETKEGGNDMKNKKQMISSISMFIILVIGAMFQLLKISELTFLEQTSQTSDLYFVVIVLFLVIFVSVVLYYLPMVLFMKISLQLHISISPVIYVSKQTKKVYQVLLSQRRYLRLHVIRC